MSDAGLIPIGTAGEGGARGTVDAGLATPDSGSGPVDGGAASQDGGAAPAHGDPPVTADPIALDGDCTADLRGGGPVAGTEGTLPLAGPYRPCTVLAGHDYTTLRMSADGRRLAALSTAGQVYVLDSRTLTLLAVLTRARGRYTAVALSADGSMVAAGCDLDGEVDVWRIADRALVRAFDLPPTWPTLGGALAISADATRVATVAGENVFIGDIATGQLRTVPASRMVTALFFVGDDHQLAFAGGAYTSSGNGDSRIDLIDLDTGAARTLVEHDDIYGVDQMEASADGSTLLTFGHGELAVWDVQSGAKRTLPQPDWREGTFWVVGLSADGTEIGALFGDSAGLWFQRRRATDDTVAAEARIADTAGQQLSFLWSSSQDLLVAPVWNTDGLAAIDLAAGQMVAKACSGHAPGQAIGFSQDAQRLLAGRSNLLADGVTVFDVHSGQPVMEAIGGPSSANSNGRTWSRDWRWTAWDTYVVQNGSVTYQVHVMDQTTQTERIFLDWQSPSYGAAIAFTPDSQHLVVVEQQLDTLLVLDVASGTPVSQVALSGSYPMPIGFTADGAAVFIQTDSTITTIRWSDGTTLGQFQVASDATTVAAGGTVASLGESQAFTYRDGQLLATMPGITDFCFGFTPVATISPDGTTVALTEGCSRPWTLGHTPHVDVRDTTTGALIQQVFNDAPVAFSPDTSTFAGAGGLLWCR